MPGRVALYFRRRGLSGAEPRWTMKWWPGRELNPRHADFQSAALPTELPGQCEPRIKQGGRQLVNE
jgi:hypothetical protein